MTDTEASATSETATASGRNPSVRPDIVVEGYDELLSGLRATFESGRTRPMAWRRRQLEGLLRMLDECESEFIEALSHDLGRPVLEALGSDIGHSRLDIRYTLKHFEHWARTKKVKPGLLSLPATAEIISEPLGVALIISPWNYPVQLLVEPMAAALAAGNCVVAKPSEHSPATTAVLAHRLPQYLDNEAVVVVEGAVPETTRLLEQRFDHIFFTGSTSVGKVVMAAAAKHLTPVTLELGGKSPAIVAADADLTVSARRIAFGRLMNAGQTCIAPDYVLVDESVKDRFVDEITSVIRGFYGDNPRSSPDLARIVDVRHHARLTGLIASSGGTIACGGEGDEASRYLAPTVIVDPDLDAPIMNEEIFGPVLPVVSVASVDEAISFVTARPKPLALYVFSESSELVDRVLARTSSGGVAVNHALVHILPETLPFGGVGASGMGAYHGRVGFDAFSHRKSVLRKSVKPDPSLLYPPYSTLKERVIRRVFK